MNETPKYLRAGEALTPEEYEQRLKVIEQHYRDGHNPTDPPPSLAWLITAGIVFVPVVTVAFVYYRAEDGVKFLLRKARDARRTRA